MLFWAYTLHVVAVTLYVGGSVFLDLIFSPAQNSIPPSQASVIGQRVGRQFAVVAWVALFVIGASGVVQLYMLGIMSELLYTTEHGRWLLVKTFAWVVLAVDGAIMTVLLRPRLEGKLRLPVVAEDADRKREDLIRASVTLNRLVRFNTLLALAALVIGASLRHGGLVIVVRQFARLLDW